MRSNRMRFHDVRSWVIVLSSPRSQDIEPYGLKREKKKSVAPNPTTNLYQVFANTKPKKQSTPTKKKRVRQRQRSWSYCLDMYGMRYNNKCPCGNRKKSWSTITKNKKKKAYFFLLLGYPTSCVLSMRKRKKNGSLHHEKNKAATGKL